MSSAHHSPRTLSPADVEAGPGTAVFARAAAVVGLLSLGLGALLGYFKHGSEIWRPFLFSYTVSYAYVLSLGLGTLFFVLLHHLTRAGWSVTVRRLAELCSTTFPLLLVLFVPIIIGLDDLYPWVSGKGFENEEEAHAAMALIQHKLPYLLNAPFFYVRWAIYFVVWIGLSQYFYAASRRQDETGDPAITLRLQKYSSWGMLLFAITTTFAAFDLLMSLEPRFYSTIFGVYFFAGGAFGTFALLIVMVYLLQQAGRMTQAVTIEHYHDLGKLLFAFTVFWTYIAFSQYMLIWYGNLPEENFWYERRQEGQWVNFSLALLFGHFVIPFLYLVSRHPKRNKVLLVLAACWALLMHWIDMYYLVMPQAPGARGVVPLQLTDLTCWVGLLGLCAAHVAWRMPRTRLAPVGDPRLPEALAFENM